MSGGKYGYLTFARDYDPLLKKHSVWNERCIQKEEDIIKAFEEHPRDIWCSYFSMASFDREGRRKEYACIMPFLYADMDSGMTKAESLGLMPTLFWQSSPGHFYGIWIVDGMKSIDEQQALNKKLTYAIGADKSGWDLTQVFRIPCSLHLKDINNQHEVSDLSITEFTYKAQEMASKLAAIAVQNDRPKADDAILNAPIAKIDREEFMTFVNSLDIPSSVKLKLKATSTLGESRYLILDWLEKRMCDAGMAYDDICKAVANSVWNKFMDDRREAKADYQIRQEVWDICSPYIDTDDDPKLKIFDTDIGNPAFMSSGFLDIANLRNNGPIMPEMLINRVLPAKGVGLIFAGINMGKTTVSTDWGGAISEGIEWAPALFDTDDKPLGGFPVKQGTVVLINLDDSEEIQQINARSTANAYDIKDNLRFKMMEKPWGFTLMEADAVKALYKRLRDVKPVMVVLDNYGLMTTGDENNTTAKPAIGNAKKLAKALDCLVLLVHHTTKAREGDKSINSASGSGILGRYVDFGIQLTEKSKGVLEVTRVKVRGAPKDDPPLLIRRYEVNGGTRFIQVSKDEARSLEAEEEGTKTVLERKAHAPEVIIARNFMIEILSQGNAPSRNVLFQNVNEIAKTRNVGEIGTRTCDTALASLRAEGIVTPKDTEKKGKQAIAIVNKK